MSEGFPGFLVSVFKPLGEFLPTGLLRKHMAIQPRPWAPPLILSIYRCPHHHSPLRPIILIPNAYTSVDRTKAHAYTLMHKQAYTYRLKHSHAAPTHCSDTYRYITYSGYTIHVHKHIRMWIVHMYVCTCVCTSILYTDLYRCRKRQADRVSLHTRRCRERELYR